MVIAGGISFYGVGKIIFLNGTMNEFAYAQTLLFYNEDKKIGEHTGKTLILEQVVAYPIEVKKI